MLSLWNLGDLFYSIYALHDKAASLAEENKEEFHLPRQHIACRQFYALILWSHWIPSEGGIELWWSYLRGHLHWRNIWRRALLSVWYDHCSHRWNWPIVLMRSFQSWRLASTGRSPQWCLCQWEIVWYHYSIALSICLDLVLREEEEVEISEVPIYFFKNTSTELETKMRK